MADSPVHIFGIRHHGPGSARTLERALRALEPDAILIEGPPDADHLIPLAADAGMKPPVALLVYEAEAPSNAVFYPFAQFSPEWRAVRFGLESGAAVRFMDLPVTHRMALTKASADGPGGLDVGEDDEEGGGASGDAGPVPLRVDPIGRLAEAAGFSDGERWWEHMIEHRRDESDEVFEAVLEAMASLREEVEDGPEEDGGADVEQQMELKREAFMRRTIREAQREFGRIAVVCGAWHAPALADMPNASADSALLKGMPKLKVECTWTPWTHRRLTFVSGYGAGVRSPGWYDHLWTHKGAIAERWLTRVARLLRDQDLDASSAHVIESVRLAGALAAMRDRAIPGLDELTEATEAVLCAGDPTPLKLIEDRLIVGDRLGEVPEDAPSIPLQRDLEKTLKSVRMKRSADEEVMDLDLRKPVHLERSHLLHRLRLLNIPWGEREDVRGKAGTFHEVWRVRWEPEFAVRIVEAGAWGNTVLGAATGRVTSLAEEGRSIAELTALVDDVLLADLPVAASRLVEALRERAATENDVAHLMDALPPLARVMRYGNVRKTDSEMVGGVLDELATRICVGLPAACVNLNEEASADMAGRIGAVGGAFAVLSERLEIGPWHEALARVAEAESSGAEAAGRAARIILDAGYVHSEHVATWLSLTMSRASDPARASAWLEGFLAGSGLVLLHDDRLWGIIDDWVGALSAEHFNETVPVLRRTFSTFPAGERRMLGERVKGVGGATRAAAAGLDEARARKALEVVQLILDLPEPTEASDG